MPWTNISSSTPQMGRGTHFRLARQMSKIGQGLGEVHRKLYRMGNNRPHPHPDKTAGKILSWLNNFSVRLLHIPYNAPYI